MDLRLHDAAIFLYYFKDDFLNIVISLSLSLLHFTIAGFRKLFEATIDHMLIEYTLNL